MNATEYDEFKAFIESTAVSDTMRTALIEGYQAIYKDAVMEGIFGDMWSSIKAIPGKVKEAIANHEPANQQAVEKAKEIAEKTQNSTSKAGMAAFAFAGALLAASSAFAGQNSPDTNNAQDKDNSAEYDFSGGDEDPFVINKVKMGPKIIRLYTNGNVMVEDTKENFAYIAHPNLEISFCDSDGTGVIGSKQISNGKSLAFGHTVKEDSRKACMDKAVDHTTHAPKNFKSHMSSGFKGSFAKLNDDVNRAMIPNGTVQSDFDIGDKPKLHTYDMIVNGHGTEYKVDGKKVTPSQYAKIKADEDKAIHDYKYGKNPEAYKKLHALHKQLRLQ